MLHFMRVEVQTVYVWKFTTLFGTCMTIRLLSTSWSIIVQLLIQSNYILTCFGGNHHHHHQGGQHHRPKTLLLEGVYLAIHTLLHFASNFNTDLIMSHFPRMCTVHSIGWVSRARRTWLRRTAEVIHFYPLEYIKKKFC
jgi:hypothetical protein